MGSWGLGPGVQNIVSIPTLLNKKEVNLFVSNNIKDGYFPYLLSLCKDCLQVCHTLIQAQRISACAASDLQHLDLAKQVNRKTQFMI